MQFIEELPDRQAADAVRDRIDWKYALGLELSDPGFDFTLLSDFRKRLVQGEAEQVLLDAMLTLFKERGWLKERGKQRTDSTHILAKIRAINRLLCVGEAMRFALNSLAIVAGEWLLGQSEEGWVQCYGHRIEEARLPSSRAERQALAEMIGRDGADLLEAIFAPSAPPCSASFLLWNSYARSGSRIINGKMVNSAGGAMRRFPRQPSLSVPPTTRKLATAKSGVRPGSAIKSI